MIMAVDPDHTGHSFRTADSNNLVARDRELLEAIDKDIAICAGQIKYLQLNDAAVVKHHRPVSEGVWADRCKNDCRQQRMQYRTAG